MFTGTGVHAASLAIVLVILARLLTPEDYGLVGAALVVVGILLTFSQLGIGPSIVQRPELEDRHLRTGFTVSTIFGGVVTVLMYCMAPAISSFFRMDGLIPVIRLISLVFLLQGPAIVAQSLLQRELRFKWLAGVRILSFTIGYGMVGVCLALMKFGVWSLVWAHIGQSIVSLIILLIVQPHPKRPQIEWQALRELMYFGGGFTTARIANYIAGHGDQMIVGRWLGAEALGLYGRAYQLMSMPAMLFGQVLDSVLFPAMAKVQKQTEKLGRVYIRGVAAIALLVLPVSAVSFVLAPELIHVVLGPKWVKLIVPFQIFAIGMLFRTSYKMGDSLSRATGAVYRRAWRQILYAALVLSGAYLGSYWGISGVVCGVVGAITANFILMAHLSLRLTKITWKKFFLAQLPGAFLAIVVFFEALIIAGTMRNLMFSPLVVVSVSLLTIALTEFLLIWLMPTVFLGQDGRWMLQKITDYLSERIKPIHRLQRGT